MTRFPSCMAILISQFPVLFNNYALTTIILIQKHICTYLLFSFYFYLKIIYGDGWTNIEHLVCEIHYDQDYDIIISFLATRGKILLKKHEVCWNSFTAINNLQWIFFWDMDVPKTISIFSFFRGNNILSNFLHRWNYLTSFEKIFKQTVHKHMQHNTEFETIQIQPCR